MNTTIKKLSYGITNFEKLVNKNYAYVDKTRFIETLENEHNPYHVFIRPRKFGKSLLLSTLYYYYSINEAHKFKQLFGNLYIGLNPTPEQGQYAIMNFDFSGINTKSEEKFTDSFNNTVQNTVITFAKNYLSVIPGLDYLIKNLENRQVGIMALRDAFTEAKLVNVKIFAIVDEYDHFANDLIAMGNQLGKNIYDQMVKANGLVRDFYETLKIGTATCLDRIFITGISPVMLNDLTSGFNIADNLTLKRKYNEILGFTHGEVQQLINEANVDTTLININLETYYNGYKFHEEGLNKVYNPTMIMGFLKQIIEDGKPPRNLVDENLKTDYGRLKNLIQNEGNRDTLIEIVKNNGIEADIVRQFPIDSMYSNEYFVSLLFYMGLLTIDGFYDGELKLKIPNLSIQTLFWDYLSKIISENPDVEINVAKQKYAVKELAFKANPVPFFDYVSKNIFSKFSNRDLRHFDEKYIKAVILCCSVQNNIFTPLSELEVDNGYIDIFLQRNTLNIKTFEWAFELKYIKVADKNKLTDVKNQATKQLLKYKQATLLKNKTDVKFAAVIFIGKDQYEIVEVE